MPVEIIEVTNAAQRKAFVTLPFNIYKGNKFWAPPLIKDEQKNIMPEYNPAFEFCRAKFWIAKKNGKVAGRIGAIINDRYNEKKSENNGRISRVEFFDDEEVSSALFQTAETWLKQQGVEGIYGPLGFTNLDTQGLLVEGFDQLQSIASTYHHAYYQKHFEKNGYVKEIDWLEFRLTLHGVPAKASRLAEIVKQRNKLNVIRCQSKKELAHYAPLVFDLLNASFEELPFVIPFDDKMKNYYIKKYFGFLNYDFVKLITTQQGDLAGFIIGVPSMSKAMQKANGRLFPFGFIHLLKAMKHNDTFDIFLTGVDPKLQSLGIPALLINELQAPITKTGVSFAETTGIFETNQKAITTWKNYEHIQHKRRRCYKKMF